MTSPRRGRCRMLRPSAWRWASGSAPHWTSCRSITGWRAVLGRWSRVAIAAAAVLAFVGGYLAGHARDAATSFDAAWVTSATGSESAVQLLAVHRAPDPSALFASMLAN